MYYHAFYAILDAQNHAHALERIDITHRRVYKLQEEREIERQKIDTEWDYRIKRWVNKHDKSLLKLIGISTVVALMSGVVISPFTAIAIIVSVVIMICYSCVITVVSGVVMYGMLIFTKIIGWWFLSLINKEEWGSGIEFLSRLIIGFSMAGTVFIIVMMIELALPDVSMDVYKLVSLALVFALAIDRRTPLRISGRR